MVQNTSGDSYQNKSNDYSVTLPLNDKVTKDGIRLEKDGYVIVMKPTSGDFTHEVVEENAIRYNQVFLNFFKQIFHSITLTHLAPLVPIL